MESVGVRIIVAQDKAQTPEERARYRAKYLTDLVWHTGTFLIINAFLWTLDIVVGQVGVQWAFWVTIVWGLALAFHALSYLVEGRQLEDRKTQQYLDNGPTAGTEGTENLVR